MSRRRGPRQPRPRLRLLGAALTAAALTATTTPAAADPQPMGQCTTTSGAVLAVDFSDWGGPVLRSCGTTPTTGYELLNQGGWRTTGTGHDGPAFICRIGYSGYQNGKQFPTAAEDDCVLTPPASAYWSYWHADPGQRDWSYSQLGAMLYEPKPGSVDLWVFGGTDIEGTEGRPTVTPDQLRAKNTSPQGNAAPPAADDKAPPLPPDADTGPAPEQRTTAPPKPSPTKPEPTPTMPEPTPKKPEKSTSPPPSPTPTASTSPATTPPAVAAPPPSPSPTVVDAAPAADAPHDTGSLTPVLTGAALVALVGGAAVFAARRRRRTE